MSQRITHFLTLSGFWVTYCRESTGGLGVPLGRWVNVFYDCLAKFLKI